MAASLTKIKGFIQTYSGYNFSTLSPTEYEDLKIFVSQSVSTLRWEMEDEYQALTDETERSSYITGLQSQLTYMADGITDFKSGDEVKEQLAPVFEWLLANIFDLLEHIRIYFPTHFDFESLLPVAFVNANKAGHQSLTAHICDTLTQLNTDPVLIELIRAYGTATEKTERFKIKTWRQWVLLTNALEAISNLTQVQPTGDLELELLKLFVQLEFNSIQVYAYFLKYIEKITLSDQGIQDQQQDLLYLLKTFKQVRIEGAYPYDPQVPSLKDSVVESITAELNYLEEKEKIYLQNFKATDDDASNKFYFRVMVTLAELMFLFRVFLEVGFINTKFKSYLYEFVSNHIQTERSEKPSLKSQRNHFSNKLMPDRVVQSIRSWLTKMIDHIDLHYKVSL